MAIGAKSAHAPPLLNEISNFRTNIWCWNCNQYGHSDQFCPFPRNYGPCIPPQPRPHTPIQSGGGQSQPKSVLCPTCSRMHPLGPRICWIEIGVVCKSCRGNHSTDKCRRPKKGLALDASSTTQPSPNLFYNGTPQGTQEYYMSLQTVQWCPPYGGPPFALHPVMQPPYPPLGNW